MSETPDRTPSRPGPRRPGRVRKLWGWLLDYAYVTYWWLRAFLGRSDPDVYLHPRTGTQPKAPVLIIPGVYESWRVMQPVADHLFRAAHPVHVLEGAKIAVAPGMGSGDYGDDHVRIALIENEHRLRQAVRGIRDMFRKDGLLRGAA